MLKDLLKVGAWTIGTMIVVGAVLYWVFGLRVELTGGASPRLAFPKSAEQQAAEVERHRQAQRANMPAPVAPSLPPAVPPTTADPAPAGTRPPENTAGAAAPYWTDFRGPARDGNYREMPILTTWPERGLTPIWKQPVGGGYASFVIARGRAFTIEQRGTNEVIAAYDVETGRELWTNQWAAAFKEFMGGDGPRATPTWSDGLVYAQGAEGELRCLQEATGKVVWRKNILEENGAANLQWGVSVSPLVVDDTVVVLAGGPGGKSIVAYDRKTGERRWSTENDRQSYTSPMLVTLADTRQLLVVSASRMMGLTPDQGKVLWQYPWVTQYDINAAQPVIVSDSRVFISSGYGVGAAVVEITRTGSDFGVREIWRNIRMKNRFNSSLLHEGFIYGLDEGILACVDAATGDLKWKSGRYGYGQLILASGHLIVLAEDGDLALVRATPAKHEELVRFSVFDGKTWNNPALAGGFLLVRNLQEMAAFDLRPKPAVR